MLGRQRLEQIVELVDSRGFVSVTELSKAFDVSEVTIRRDLQRLEGERRVQRTHGGAFSLHPPASADGSGENAALPPSPWENLLAGRVSVLIATPVEPNIDRSLLDRVEQGGIPLIAESQGMPGAQTVVAVDNYQAALELGQWAGEYAREHFGGEARVLDLTFQQSNTLARSEGFLAGLRSRLPSAQTTLSINAQSKRGTAYQLMADALQVHPDINIIFAINDATAAGAAQACHDRGVALDSLLLLTFGLEGDTLKNLLMAGSYCKAGLAMFPEIVGPVCIEAAIAAYNGKSLPGYLCTPHAILTAETLPQFYAQTGTSWRIKWDAVLNQLSIPLNIDKATPRSADKFPARLGFVVPFMEHEWYRNLITCLQDYAQHLAIGLEVIDADQILEDDIALRQQAIAQAAAQAVKPGDVLLLDGGQITLYLAEELVQKENITVITNSVPIFQTLRDRPGITLISTGGMLRHSSEMMIGPTAEAALRELRADKLFLSVTGITLDFGLSHTNVAEVAMKQTMIRAAREVILLADHTTFGQEAVMQVGPATLVHRIITDNALPASRRLELSKLGIDVIIAKTNA